jgi:hypothetical protein
VTHWSIAAAIIADLTTIESNITDRTVTKDLNALSGSESGVTDGHREGNYGAFKDA